MKRLILACLVALIFTNAEAALPFGPTDAEMATLPSFCRARLRDVSVAEKKMAESSLGVNNFIHIHHYCFSRNFVRNRLNSIRDPQKKKEMFNEIIQNYDYVLTHGERTFWMRPQIHLEMGQVYERMQQKGAAMAQYSHAINFNPDFQAAYLPLVAAQRALGDSKGALETATEGLRHFPASQGLRKVYLNLGGKQPFPAPLERGLSSNKTIRDADVAIELDTKKSRNSAEEESESRDVPSESAQTSGAQDQVEQGCRFCPPEEIQQRWRESFDGPATRY